LGLGLGCGIWLSWLGVWGLGFEVWGLGLGFGVWDEGLGGCGLRSGVWDVK
jgi:hypothetical protein